MKTLLVTGGTGEFGHFVVPRLLLSYRVIITVRGEHGRAKAAELGQSDQLVVVDEGTPIDEAPYGVVLLAGAFGMGSTAADFTKMLDANLLSAVRAIGSVKVQDGGRIVAVSSAASRTKPAGMAAYVAAKAALNAYIEVLARELRPRGITANAILPTALDTPSMRGTASRNPLVPLDRVASTIEFLLSDGAASITGQLIALS